MRSHGSNFLDNSQTYLQVIHLLVYSCNVKKTQKRCELKETYQSNRIK